jgi:hypothetical protein
MDRLFLPPRIRLIADFVARDHTPNSGHDAVQFGNEVGSVHESTIRHDAVRSGVVL